VPGYNACSSDISVAVAQLLALGAFTAHIKPFIFAWPNGRELSHPIATKLCVSQEMGLHLASFFESVLDAGVVHIHVLAHSMGARLLLTALPEVVKVLSARSVKLASCIFLNADHPLERFVHTDYALLRAHCHHITIYADVNDRALWYSHVVNSLIPAWGIHEPLGRYPYGFCYANDTSTIAEARKAWRRTLRLEQQVDYLDLDVVDTSSLDANVHGLRHAYFNLNPFIVDDLAEIVTMRKRACMRLKLTHCVGNVWTFLAAPGHVQDV